MRHAGDSRRLSPTVDAGHGVAEPDGHCHLRLAMGDGGRRQRLMFGRDCRLLCASEKEIDPGCLAWVPGCLCAWTWAWKREKEREKQVEAH